MKKASLSLILIFLFLSACKKQEVNDLQGGFVTFLKGTAEIVRGDGKKSLLKTEDFVMSGETVLTGPDSYADIQFKDGVLIRVKENTEFYIEEIWINSGKNEVKARLKVRGGKLFSKITQKMTKESEFTVVTPSSVAGVRGTEFMVDDTGKTTKTMVNDGSVMVAPTGNPEQAVTIDEGNKGQAGTGKITVTELTEAEKNEMAEDSQSIASITEDARARMQEILKDFEENKKRIREHLEEQKESDRALLDEQKEKNREMIDSVKSGADADKAEILQKTEEAKKGMTDDLEKMKQKKGNLLDQVKPE